MRCHFRASRCGTQHAVGPQPGQQVFTLGSTKTHLDRGRADVQALCGSAGRSACRLAWRQNEPMELAWVGVITGTVGMITGVGSLLCQMRAPVHARQAVLRAEVLDDLAAVEGVVTLMRDRARAGWVEGPRLVDVDNADVVSDLLRWGLPSEDRFTRANRAVPAVIAANVNPLLLWTDALSQAASAASVRANLEAQAKAGLEPSLSEDFGSRLHDARDSDARAKESLERRTLVAVKALGAVREVVQRIHDKPMWG